jgi:MFS family permease
VTERIQWPFLANAVLGQFLAGLTARSFTISLPTVASNLGTDILGISWALISFQLASVSLSLVFGRLGDLYGRSKLCALGFVVLATSSFLCGMAQDVVQLIAFRFLQGIGGAMVQSSARAMAMDAVPPGWEGKAQGFMTVAFHTGFFIGIVSLFTLSITRGLVAFLLPFYLQDILGLAPSFMGLLFLVQPIFTLSLAPVSGHMTDRIGPRVPATLGVLSSLASVLVGLFFRPDSHWWIPAVMLAFSGAGTALFNSANQAAVIGSVPPDYRGFATGMVYTGFELGHMLGVSVGGVLLTVAYHYYSGIPDATPGPNDPEAFVSSMNVSYLSAAACCIVALATSLLRGSGKIRAAKEDR